MKKIILSLIFFPMLAFGQQIKQDSLLLDGKLIGRIKFSEILESTDKAYYSYSAMDVSILVYDIAINEFLSRHEIAQVKIYLNSMMKNHQTETKGKQELQFRINEVFEGKSNQQISGYYLKKAGGLKNTRNNCMIVGSLISISIAIVFPPSIPTLLASSGVGLFTGIVSLEKDYKANQMMKKSGEHLMK